MMGPTLCCPDDLFPRIPTLLDAMGIQTTVISNPPPNDWRFTFSLGRASIVGYDFRENGKQFLYLACKHTDDPLYLTSEMNLLAKIEDILSENGAVLVRH